LGHTDIRVSAVCQGCWSIVGDSTWGPQDQHDSIAALQACLDAGINFFDTAEAYGDGYSEQLIRKALGDARGEIVLASKVSSERLDDPSSIKSACEASLRRLGTDTIDLYQIHWPSPRANYGEVMGAMEQLRREGKIRAVGVSNFGPGYLDDVLAAGRVESNQLCYSLLWRAIEFNLHARCVEEGMSILCYSPLCQGLLTGKFATADDVPAGRARSRLFSKNRPQSRHGQAGCETELFDAIAKIRQISDELHQPMGNVSLAWLLAQKGVVSVIAGARNAKQAAENAAAAEIRLTSETIARLSEATEAVKAYVGANADMWEATSRMEKRP